MWQRINYFLPRCVFILSVLTAAMIIIRDPVSDDSWLHMGMGKYIMTFGALPHHTDISYKQVLPSMEILPHSWATDVLLYLITNTHIFATALCIGVGLFAFTLIVLFRSLMILHIQKSLAYIMLTATSLLMLSFWQLHPLLFAAPLLSILVFLYLTWRYTTSHHWWNWILVMLVFANFAGGFLILPIFLIVLLILWESALWLYQKRLRIIPISKHSPLSLILTGIAAIATSLMSPNHIYNIIYGITTYSILTSPRKTLGTLLGALKILYQHYVKSPQTPLFYTLSTLYILLFLGLLAYLIIRQRRTINPHIYPLLPLLLFLIPAFLWVRFIPLAIVVTLPLFALSLQTIMTLTSHARTQRILSLCFLFSEICMLVAVLHYGYTLLPVQLPKEQVQFIQAHDLPDTILTSPDITGYLFYTTGRKVLVDAQDDLYDTMETTHFYIYEPMVTMEEIKNIEQHLRVSTILIDREYGQLPVTLAKSPEWHLLYFDYSGYLFIKRFTVNESFLDTNQLRYVHFDTPLGFDVKEATQAASELTAFIQKYPNNTLAIGQLASVYRISGDLQKAYDLLIAIPASERTWSVSTELGRIQGARGLCKSAESYFLTAISDRNEMNYSRAILDLAVLYALCFGDKQKAYHYFQRYDSFALPPEERERVRQIMEQVEIQLNPQ